MVSKFNTKKCGPHRAKFMIESVQELRKNLQSLNWDLLVFHKRPEEAIHDIIKERFDISRDKGPQICKTFILF